MGNGSSVGNSPQVLNRLQRQFNSLAGPDGAVTVKQLLLMPELAGNPMVPRLFQVMDQNGDGKLSGQEFSDMLAYLSRIRSLRDLTELAFKVYDLDGNGAIDAVELHTLLHSVVGDRYAPKQLERVVDATIQEYDKDGDGNITFEEFTQLMSEQELLSKFTLAL